MDIIVMRGDIIRITQGDQFVNNEERFVALESIHTDSSRDLLGKSFRKLEKDEIPPESHECSASAGWFFPWLFYMTVIIPLLAQ